MIQYSRMDCTIAYKRGRPVCCSRALYFPVRGSTNTARGETGAIPSLDELRSKIRLRRVIFEDYVSIC